MKYLRWLGVAVLVVGLIFVRKWELQLFYDPLLPYFKGDFLNNAFPAVDVWKHLGSIFFRYLLNTLLSLGILYFIFLDKNIVRFCGILFFAFFLLFLLPYYYFVTTEFSHLVTAGFYVRRLLIQPVLLLILIPAIFYWKHQKSKGNI